MIVILFNVGCTQPKAKQVHNVVVQVFEHNNKMDDAEFWKIIDYSFGVADGDLTKQRDVITEKLSEYTPQQIIDFEVIFCKKLIELNDYNFFAIENIIDGGGADDDFIYFRCWLISRGKETFEQTIKNPDNLAKFIEKGVDASFESLLYVSTNAYKNETGKKVEDDNFPRGVAFNKGLNYDFGGPKITGTNWKEGDLPKLYPNLWKMFN